MFVLQFNKPYIYHSSYSYYIGFIEKKKIKKKIGFIGFEVNHCLISENNQNACVGNRKFSITYPIGKLYSMCLYKDFRSYFTAFIYRQFCEVFFFF